MRSHIARKSDRVYVTEKQIRDAVEKEIDALRLELYKSAVQDITVQTLATVLYTLEVCYGWKEQRLKKFIEYMHDIEHMMIDPSPLHHRFTHVDNEKHLKNKYGIDLVKEFPAHVEVKK